MSALVKICGIRTSDCAVAAAAAGADFIGFDFRPKGLRFIPPEAAEEIVTDLKQAADEEGFAVPKFVGVFADPGERAIAECAPILSHVQLMGREDAARVREVRDGFGLAVIKLAPVPGDGDFEALADLAEVADFLLFDSGMAGRAARYDFEALKGYAFDTPFLIGGTFDPQNVAHAVRAAAGFPAFAGVDASGGLESRAGVLDAVKVAALIRAAKI